MPVLLEWSGVIRLNLPEIDDQHEEIVSCLNDINEALETSAPESRLLELQESLFQNLRLHFATEERLMSHWRCSSLAAHKDEHDRLLRMVGSLPLSIPVVQYVRGWLTNHLSNCDTLMQRELNGLR